MKTKKYNIVMPKDYAEEDKSTNSIVTKVDEKESDNKLSPFAVGGGIDLYKQKKGAAPFSNYKPFDYNTGLKSYQVNGKLIKKLLKKMKSENALRDLSGHN